MTVSDYMRRSALKQKFVSEVDDLWLGELRRIVGLLRRHYPAVVSWSEPEKHRYWQTRDLLLALADEFAKKVGLKSVRLDRKEPQGE